MYCEKLISQTKKLHIARALGDAQIKPNLSIQNSLSLSSLLFSFFSSLHFTSEIKRVRYLYFTLTYTHTYNIHYMLVYLSFIILIQQIGHPANCLPSDKHQSQTHKKKVSNTIHAMYDIHSNFAS